MLRLLQNDGRLSNAELAEGSVVSPATCHRRTQRLFDEGYIAHGPRHGRAAQGRQGRAGDGRRRARPLDAGKLCRLRKSGREAEFVLDCHLVAGDFDYFLKIRAGDIDDFKRCMATS